MKRILGQDVSVVLILNGQPLRTVNDVRSFEMTFQLETKSEGYLGETTNRKDSIFNGIRGKLELHFENEDVFTLIQAVIDRARMRTAGTTVNLKATLAMPNGDRPKVIISNVEFGEIPMNFAGRADYGSIGLDFEAEYAQVIS